MPLTVNDIIRLYDDHGDAWYGGEAVTHRQHALQCAWLAERDGAAPNVIIACLLHDLGHLFHEVEDDDPVSERCDVHDLLAVRELAHLFPPAVLTPIRLHVTAKRFRCANEPGYLDGLSPTARLSVELHGGVLPPGQCAAFMSVPWSDEALRLSRYDDEATVRQAPTPDLEHFRPMMRRLSFTIGRRMAAV